jgi:hypothetical protein
MSRYKNKYAHYSDEKLRNLKVDVARIAEWENELVKIRENFGSYSVQAYHLAVKTVVDSSETAPNKIREILWKSLFLCGRYDSNGLKAVPEMQKWLESLDAEKLLQSSNDINAPYFARNGLKLNLHYLLQQELNFLASSIREIETQGTTDSFFGKLFSGKSTPEKLNSLRNEHSSLNHFRIYVDRIESAAAEINKVWELSKKTMRRFHEIEERIQLAKLKLGAIERFEIKYGKDIAKGKAADSKTRQTIGSIKRLVKKTSTCPYCNLALGDSPHLDHIYPVSRGGLNIIENLVWCCSSCNSAKSDKGLITFLQERGLSVADVSTRLKALGKLV